MEMLMFVGQQKVEKDFHFLQQRRRKNDNFLTEGIILPQTCYQTETIILFCYYIYILIQYSIFIY